APKEYSDDMPVRDGKVGYEAEGQAQHKQGDRKQAEVGCLVCKKAQENHQWKRGMFDDQIIDFGFPEMTQTGESHVRHRIENAAKQGEERLDARRPSQKEEGKQTAEKIAGEQKSSGCRPVRQNREYGVVDGVKYV